MTSTRPNSPGAGVLARVVRRVSGAAARRPRTMIVLWLALVVGCVIAGSMTGTQKLTGAQAGVGQSARADRIVDKTGLRDPAVESVLVRSSSAASTRSAAQAVVAHARTLPQVSSVRGPADSPALSHAGGRTVLVQVTLRGDPDKASDHIAPLQRAVASVRAQHRGVTLQESGSASMEKAVNDIVGHDLKKAEVFSIPVTLVILVLAFGAIVAASVPLLLGLTSVVAALGGLGVVSQIAPIDDSASSLVLLIGLAVGVDYSLFYIRREREERRAGRGAHAALEASSATVGRAIVVSGLTVMVALGGLLVTGLSVFKAMALATMFVVAIAVLGSLTVLPAMLALLGDRVDRGRLPGVKALRARRARREARAGRRLGAWAALARSVTRRPGVALVIAVCVLGTLAVPALQMHTADATGHDLSPKERIMVDTRAIERAFPGAPDAAQLVVTGSRLDGAAARHGLQALGQRALRLTGGRGQVAIDVARNGRTAIVSVPMPNRSARANDDTVHALRSQVAPTAARVAPGAKALVTGDAASNADFTSRLKTSTPLVIAFVLGLAFVLLIAAFRSPALAATVMGLNLLSVGAAYGVLVAVFQHHWAESTLHFTSSGAIVNWIPLFCFVILFGLSMDYTVLVLERIREARAAGMSPREAAAEGVGATAGTITGAAVVMVAIFAIFAVLRLLEMKQLGVGLAAAVLLDATIVRGVALPAAVALLGERGPRARRARRRGAGWDDGRPAPVAASGGVDAR